MFKVNMAMTAWLRLSPLTLQARAALRDVGRVLDMPMEWWTRSPRWCQQSGYPGKYWPALKSEADLRRLNDEDEQVAHLIATARKLEGLYRLSLPMRPGWLSQIEPCQSWCRFIAIRARICLLPSSI